MIYSVLYEWESIRGGVVGGYLSYFNSQIYIVCFYSTSKYCSEYKRENIGLTHEGIASVYLPSRGEWWWSAGHRRIDVKLLSFPRQRSQCIQTSPQYIISHPVHMITNEHISFGCYYHHHHSVHSRYIYIYRYHPVSIWYYTCLFFFFFWFDGHVVVQVLNHWINNSVNSVLRYFFNMRNTDGRI